MEKSALPFSRSLRKVEASALLAKCWLVMKRFITPKRLFNNPRDPGNSRSARFNLSTIPPKPRLTENAPSAPIRSAPEQRGFSSVGRASALQAECQRFESVNLHHSSPIFAKATKGYEWQAIACKQPFTTASSARACPSKLKRRRGL